MTFLSSGNFNSVIKSLKIASKWKAACQQGWECYNFIGHFSSNIFILFALLIYLEFISSQIKTSTFCIDNTNPYVVLKNTIYFNNWKNTVGQCRNKESISFLSSNLFYAFFPVLYASLFEQFIFEQSLLHLKVNDGFDPRNAKGFCFFSLLQVCTCEILLCISSAGTCLCAINSLLKSIAIWCTMSNYHKNLTATLDRLTYLVHCSLLKKKGDWQ